MKSERGFTLIELIMTIVLSAILSVIVVEIVAGPIRAYFWVDQQLQKLEVGEQIMASLGQELSHSYPQDFQLTESEALTTLQYRKVVYSGVMLAASPLKITIAGELPLSVLNLAQEQNLWIAFSSSQNTRLYAVKRLTQQAIETESVTLKAGRFYLISDLRQIEFNPSTQLIEQIIPKKDGSMQRILLGNQLKTCHFILPKNNMANQNEILVSLIFTQNQQSVNLFQHCLGERL